MAESKSPPSLAGYVVNEASFKASDDPAFQLLVEAKRKAVPPTYYAADLKTRQTIGQDTEAALIGLPTSIKDKAASYLKGFLNREERSSEYGDLQEEFAEKQMDNAVNSTLEMDALFEDFFRQGQGIRTFK